MIRRKNVFEDIFARNEERGRQVSNIPEEI